MFFFMLKGINHKELLTPLHKQSLHFQSGSVGWASPTTDRTTLQFQHYASDRENSTRDRVSTFLSHLNR